MIDTEELATRIQELYGSPRKFANEVDISYTNILRILREGIQTTSVDNACKICIRLGIPFERMLSDSDCASQRIDIVEAERLYARYLSEPELQPAVNKLLGYQPYSKGPGNRGESHDKR